MKFTTRELEYLSAWAREEWEVECYRLPAHRLQLANSVRAASLGRLIKAWAQANGKKDNDIINAAMNSQPEWPWGGPDEFNARLSECESSV